MLVRASLAVEKSAEVVLPAGSTAAGKGPNAKPSGGRDARARGMDVERSQPRKGPAREGLTVKPEDPLFKAQSYPRRLAIPHLTLAERELVGAVLVPSLKALRRVEQNAGAPGIDGMSTKELRPWLHSHWPEVRSRLDAGTYRPQPVRRVMIPKPSGGLRMLGVPAAVDRLICQAIAQVLTPVFDPKFHPHSFGFGWGARPMMRSSGPSHRRRRGVVRRF